MDHQEPIILLFPLCLYPVVSSLLLPVSSEIFLIRKSKFSILKEITSCIVLVNEIIKHATLKEKKHTHRNRGTEGPAYVV